MEPIILIFIYNSFPVKPQQSTPATKKAPISSGPIKPRALMQPMTTSKSPVDGPLKPGKEDQDIQVCMVHSYRPVLGR